VIARSNFDPTIFANSALTVSPTPPPTMVTISPTIATITSGATQQFSASVIGPTDQSVTWLVNGTAGGAAASGPISASGFYSPPATTPRLSEPVIARSNYDPTISASATLTVTAAPPPTVVTISPTIATITSGATQQFSASVTGPTDQSVT